MRAGSKRRRELRREHDRPRIGARRRNARLVQPHGLLDLACELTASGQVPGPCEAAETPRASLSDRPIEEQRAFGEGAGAMGLERGHGQEQPVVEEGRLPRRVESSTPGRRDAHACGAPPGSASQSGPSRRCARRSRARVTPWPTHPLPAGADQPARVNAEGPRRAMPAGALRSTARLRDAPRPSDQLTGPASRGPGW